MDFLDPKQKRKHVMKLYVGYALMTLLIIFGTRMLFYFSSGLSYDSKTGAIVENGLIFVDAHPESARVSVNGQDKGSTDVRLVLPAAKYDIVLSRTGYRNWTHSLLLEGRRVERLAYPFLFPEKLVSKDAQLFASRPTFASQSPDRRWLVVKHVEKLNDFEVVDLNSQNTEGTSLTLDQSILHQGGALHTFEEVEWSTDNRHLLLKHNFEGGSEFIVIDRQAANQSVNINTEFKRQITDVALRDKKFDRYYLHDKTSGDLVSAELHKPEVVSVASRVLAYQPHGADIMLFVTEENAPKGFVLAKVKNGDKQFTLRKLPKSETGRYVIDLAQFDTKWYVAVGASEDKKVFVYINPFGGLKHESSQQPLAAVLLQLGKPIEFLSFSANARFISVQAGSSFAVYDAENVRQFKYDTKLNLPPNYEVKWMDGHRFFAVSEKNMKVFDFDGTNMQTLVPADQNFYPFFDRDYNTLYTISPSVTVKNKDAIVRTSMRFDPKAQN